MFKFYELLSRVSTNQYFTFYDSSNNMRFKKDYNVDLLLKALGYNREE